LNWQCQAGWSEAQEIERTAAFRERIDKMLNPQPQQQTQEVQRPLIIYDSLSLLLLSLFIGTLEGLVEDEQEKIKKQTIFSRG